MHDTLGMKFTAPRAIPGDWTKPELFAAQLPTPSPHSCTSLHLSRASGAGCDNHGNDWGGSGDHCDEFGLFGSGLDFRLPETGGQEEVWECTGSR